MARDILKLTKLNLGCGRDIRPDFVNVDLTKDFGADVVCDFDRIEKTPLPLKNNAFDEIICFNVLEHVKDWRRMIEEMWRVSKAGAIIKIQVPHYHCQNAFYPEHINFFTPAAFDIFTFKKSNPQKKSLKASFKLIKRKPSRIRLLLSMFIPELTQNIYWELKVLK